MACVTTKRGRLVIDFLKPAKIRAFIENVQDQKYKTLFTLAVMMDCLNLVKRHFHPALRRAGLRKIRFHDLRHTFAALLIDQGEYPKYI